MLWVLLGGLVVCAAAAGAAEEFGSAGTHAGQFLEPFGIAVDQQTGDVYVLDTNNERIEKFTKRGVFLLAWGWGVADGKTHALQRCTGTCFAGIRGAGAGELGFAEGLAVANDPQSPAYHDVYAVDLDNHRVQKFSPTGEFLLTFGREVNRTAHKYHEPNNENLCPVNPGDRCSASTPGPAAGQFEFTVEGSFIATDTTTGTVYVADRNRVQQFTPAGVYQKQVRLFPEPGAPSEHEVGGTSGLAVNSSGDLYVIRNGIRGVNEYAPSGKLLHTLTEGEPENPEGPTPVVALDSSGDAFIDYNANNEHHIDEYDSTGAKLATFDISSEDGLHGIAYSQHTKQLYIINTNGNTTPPHRTRPHHQPTTTRTILPTKQRTRQATHPSTLIADPSLSP